MGIPLRSRHFPSWLLALLGVGLLVFMLARSIQPRVPGMPITGGMPVDTPVNSGSQNFMPGMPGMRSP